MQFDQLKDRAGLAKTLERLAWTLWGLGDYDGALEASDRQLTLATEDDDSGRSTALENMGVVHWLTGDHAEALELLQEALDAARLAGYRPGVILAANDLASVRFELGQHVAAIEGLQRGALGRRGDRRPQDGRPGDRQHRGVPSAARRVRPRRSAASRTRSS